MRWGAEIKRVFDYNLIFTSIGTRTNIKKKKKTKIYIYKYSFLISLPLRIEKN